MRLRPTIVVLAAGRGSRFHGATPKLEQPLGDSTVLGCTLARAIETGCPVVVVTIAPLVPLCGTLLAKRDVIVLSDTEARRGVGHTIACGVAERPASPGWLVQPGDMPMVRPASSLAVADALAEHTGGLHAVPRPPRPPGGIFVGAVFRTDRARRRRRGPPPGGTLPGPRR